MSPEVVTILMAVVACVLGLVGAGTHYLFHKAPPEKNLAKELILGLIAGLFAFFITGDVSQSTALVYVFAGYTATSFIRNVMGSIKSPE
jgi:hypothetical protein